MIVIIQRWMHFDRRLSFSLDVLKFRRSGVQGTGIAPLMGQLGLTHGGFYAHFDSKNELIAQATGPMFEDGLAGQIFGAAEAAPKGKRVRAIVDRYLSPQHRWPSAAELTQRLPH